MNLNPTPWNGPDIVVNPVFTKGDIINTIFGSEVTILYVTKRAAVWNQFCYRVKFDSGKQAWYFENELTND
jgi:hypothetical protein